MTAAMTAAQLVRHDPVLADPVVALAEVPRPEPGPGEVVLEVGAAGVCRTDLHLASGAAIGGAPSPLPHILGHENAGWVAAVGAGVDPSWIGRAAVCYPFQTGGHALIERYGQESLTDERTRITAGINAPGGFAEYLRTSERCLVPVSDGADLALYAPLSDAGLTAYRACRRTVEDIRPGEAALVIGAGGVGHLVVQVLNAICAARIIVVDPRHAARELARSYGVSAVCSPAGAAATVVRHAPRGVAATIDVVGEDATASLGTSALRPGGTYTCVGIGGELRLPTVGLVEPEIRVQGSFTGSYTDLVEVTRLVELGLVTPEVVTVPLASAGRALGDLRDGHIAGRAVLTPDGGPAIRRR